MFSNPLFFGLLNVAIIVPLFIFIMNGIKNKDKQSNVKTSPMKEIVALGLISFVSISLTCYLVFEQITQAPTEEFLTGGAPF